jgi:pyruvate dehydrogenase E2 component (dihydrolipoamide acetyltransferase)
VRAGETVVAAARRRLRLNRVPHRAGTVRDRRIRARRHQRLTGSGPNGRIVRRDVEQAISQTRNAAPAVQRAASNAPESPATSVTPTPGDVADPSRPFELIAHSRQRRAIAERLSMSKQQISHFYVRGTATVDDLLSLRQQINDTGSVRVSINDLVVKAMACTHREVPAVNVIWTPEGMQQFDSVDLSVAVSIPGGLVTPVLRGVDRMSVGAVGAATIDFAEKARAGRLQQADLVGGTGTVTNLGMFGTEEFAAIINPPQSTILAVGAVTKEPTVNGDRVSIASRMRVTLSVDHRAIDGVLAAEWLRAFIGILESPMRILT